MKTEWDFSGIKSNFEEKRGEIEKVYDSFSEKWGKDSSYLTDKKKIKEALEEMETISRTFSGGGESYYYTLKQELDQSDSEVRRKFMDIDNFMVKQNNKIIFFSINLSKISKEKQEEFLKSQILEKFKPFLRDLFENSKYMLSEKEEKVLSLKENGAYEMWVRMVSSLLAKEEREVIDEEGKKKNLVYPELINLMKSFDEKVRDSARDAFEEILQKYEEIAEFELNAVLEEAKVNSELRGFSRPDEGRSREDLIDFEFIDSLLEAVKEKFSLTNDYYKFKAKLMGKNKIGYHERSAELKKITKEYGHEKAVNLVKKVFSKLDKEFLKIFEEMLEEGKVDFFPKKGKNGGAFCAHSRIIDPIYVLLNHTGKLRDVTVIAHEIGHAINSVLMKKDGPLYFETPKSTAEVASTFMEDFVYEEIFNEVDEEERFYLKIMKFEEDIATIQRQVALYRFELEIHNLFKSEGYLSKEKIGEIFVKHMSSYMGEAVDMKNAHLWWIYWPHIRKYFYVYSYASGLLISKAMQKKYKEDKSFMEKIKVFLSTGTSKRPREVFKEMGIKIDKNFFLDGLSELERDFNEIKELGKKLGKA